MSRRIPLVPREGIKGAALHPTMGEPVAVTFKLFLELWEPGDPPMTRTLADLKRNFEWNEASGTLTVRQSDNEVFTLGPDVLSALPDSTKMRISMMYGPAVGAASEPPRIT